MATVSWLAFRYTCSGDSSQCWTRLRGWPVTCGDPTTSLTHWPASIGCASRRESSSRSPYWHMKSSMDLRGPITCVIDLSSQRSLRSVGTNRLVVPTRRLSTGGSRAFLIAGPQTWNDLQEDVTSTESMTEVFRHLLKIHLFRKSFPDYLLDINWLSPVDLAVVPLLRPPKKVFDWMIDWLRLCGLYSGGIEVC